MRRLAVSDGSRITTNCTRQRNGQGSPCRKGCDGLGGDEAKSPFRKSHSQQAKPLGKLAEAVRLSLTLKHPKPAGPTRCFRVGARVPSEATKQNRQPVS